MSTQNQPEIDYAKQEHDRLSRDYEGLLDAINKAVADAQAISSQPINDDEASGRVAKVVKDLRDLATRINGFREAEKLPYFRRGQGVDQFFFREIERLTKRNRNDKDGAADGLYKLVNDYTQRKIAEERRRREEELRLAREEEERLAAQRAEEEHKAREALAAAERAYKPENKDARLDEAALHATAGALAKAQQEAAIDKVQDAQDAARARTADLARTRHDAGVLTTAADEPYAEINDSTLLDAVALWPFVKEDHKAMALKAWAKITQHRKPMPGADIGFCPKTVIR